MLWVNWLPEMALLVLLLASLLFLSLRKVGSSLLFWAYGATGFIALVYFWMRSDSFSYSSPYLSFVLDPLSYFGRTAVLFWCVYGVIFLGLNAVISLKNKMKILVLLTFFGAFMNTLFLAKPISMYLISWIGSYISLNFMIMLESEQVTVKTGLTRQSSILILLVSMISVLFYFFPESRELVLLLGGLVSFGFPLSMIQIRNFMVRAPLSQAWKALWVYFSAGVFWMRFGLPLLGDVPEVLGVMFSVAAIHAALICIRTNHSLVWLGSALFSAVNLSLLSLILDPEQGAQHFYSLGIAHVLAFTFVGYAFHRTAPDLKKSKMTGSLLLAAFYFPLITALIEKGFLVFACVGMLVWFLMSVSIIQQLGKLITLKNSQEVDTMPSVLVLGFYVMTVIVLTLLKPSLLQLLNHHGL